MGRALPQTKWFSFGRMFGVPVDVSAGFFIAAAFLTFPFWKLPGMANLFLAVGLAVVLFLSILVHEFAHALAGRRLGAYPQRIEIHLMGGLAHFSRMPNGWKERCLIYLVGPVANFILGGLFFILAFAVSVLLDERMFDALYVLQKGLFVAAIGNLALGIVNLLPAFPLDGGRIGYLLLTRATNPRKAARIVGWLGVALAGFNLLLLLGAALSGFLLYVPLSFTLNWRAAQTGQPG